jgi:MurNAc alpha-1-phosphate uridylyltransferase
VQCVILAGGLGTRMWPEARSVPKTLIRVAGRPFAAWQLSWLARSGITSVLYCIGHLGSHVSGYVGDGSHWGLAVGYVDEGDQLRGTAGALRLAYDEGKLAEDFLVLYGDSWLQVDPALVLRTARRRQALALMTVYRNDGRWDASNVVLRGAQVVQYAKGLAEPPPDMGWIDYGLLAFRREVIADRVPPNGAADLAPLCSQLASAGMLSGLEVTQRFYEIGSPAGRTELEELLAAEPGGHSPHTGQS